MSGWKLVYSREAQKDAKKLARSGLWPKAGSLLAILSEDPFSTPPRYETLVGNLTGCYSRRINIQHRLVYEVHADERIVHVLRMWSHYEESSAPQSTPVSPAETPACEDAPNLPAP